MTGRPAFVDIGEDGVESPYVSVEKEIVGMEPEMQESTSAFGGIDTAPDAANDRVVERGINQRSDGAFELEEIHRGGDRHQSILVDPGVDERRGTSHGSPPDLCGSPTILARSSRSWLAITIAPEAHLSQGRPVANVVPREHEAVERSVGGGFTRLELRECDLTRRLIGPELDMRKSVTSNFVGWPGRLDPVDEIAAKPQIRAVDPLTALAREPVRPRRVVMVPSVAALQKEVAHNRPCRGDRVLVEQGEESNPAGPGVLDPFERGCGEVMMTPSKLRIDGDDDGPRGAASRRTATNLAAREAGIGHHHLHGAADNEPGSSFTR